MERTWKSKYYKDIMTYRATVTGTFEISHDGGQSYTREALHKSWIEIEDFMGALGYEEITAAPNGFLGISHLQNSTGKAFYDAANHCHDLLKADLLKKCFHEWTTYVGFMKSETYCTKCKEIQK